MVMDEKEKQLKRTDPSYYKVGHKEEEFLKSKMHSYLKAVNKKQYSHQRSKTSLNLHEKDNE